MTSRSLPTIVAWLMWCGLESIATGHDLWLVPDQPAALGRPATIRANSGMNFPFSVHAPDPANFEKRIVIGPDGSARDLEPAGTRDLSGLMQFTPTVPGVHIIAVETRPRMISLSADEFNSYLVSDGLPHIYRLRSKEKSLDQPARERYSKSPKVLLRVASGGGGDPTRVVGLPLEIVPLVNPFQLRLGDTLPVRVLFRNEPLANANLGWDVPGDGDEPSGTVRTNARGEALIPVAQAGLMTVRLTHMTRPKSDDYEWESFWTTLTFEVPTNR